jgi:HK97 family phage major capsid protein
VSSAGVTAEFAAELTETTDNSPTLAQPTVSTEKAQAWVPFSIEIGQDWASLQTELARLFADAKATLEADKFLNGSGTNEPKGVYAGLTTTQRVQTATTTCTRSPTCTRSSRRSPRGSSSTRHGLSTPRTSTGRIASSSATAPSRRS